MRISTFNLTFYLSILAAFFTFASVNILNAQWSAAPDSPPAGNVPTPINVGSDFQTKIGSLGVVKIHAEEYCDENGDNCISLPGGGDFNLPDGDFYICPHIDTGGGQSCASTCVGQIGTADNCKDYEQFRRKSRDRRCRVASRHDCVQITEQVDSQ